MAKSKTSLLAKYLHIAHDLANLTLKAPAKNASENEVFYIY